MAGILTGRSCIVSHFGRALDNRCIFIVEDELSIAQTVQFTLESEGFTTQHFATGGACLAALAATPAALILLDIGLADGSGFEFFRRIRHHHQVPIIYLTARGDEIDRVVGLEMGADDYIVKPFSLRELVARVRTVLRRVDAAGLVHDAPPSAPVCASDCAPQAFQIDAVRRQIHYQKQVLDLTLHEYRLLETLLGHPQRVFTRAELLAQAWDDPDHRLERTIDSHIKSLRNKLQKIDADASPICTHRGIGYSISNES